MATNLKYVPVFRARQQEIIVLNSFQFGDKIFPLVEIVKEKDRSNSSSTAVEIYTKILNAIPAEKVFVDLPLYLKERGSMQDEVLAFSRRVISNRTNRTLFLNNLRALNQKIIPVVSSYLLRTGESNTISPQVDDLRVNYRSIAFRLFIPTFEIDFPEVMKKITADDYLILDLDTIPPYASSPSLKKIVEKLKELTKCPKIVIRSAINTDIQNVSLDHGSVIYEADNSILETFKTFGAEAFGDFGGIKKDDLTAGGTISPGFIYYDAVENQYYGFKGDVKSLSEFETTIVPAIIASDATARMNGAPLPYLSKDNVGWAILNNISSGRESGKSQAKFKRIAMEHYLHCMKLKAEDGQFN